MSIETKSMHITPAGGNIFADLGFEPGEAALLKENTQRLISEKLAIKNQLMSELSHWIVENKFTQAQAAEILGVTRPRVSDFVNHRAIKFTIDALVDMLNKVGKKIQFSVH